MICVPIVGPKIDNALDQIAWAQPLADVIELRLDLIHEPDLPRLLSASKRPVIATCRPRNNGGAFEGGEGLRLAMLRKAAVSGAKYVDIEWQAATRLGDVGDAVLIISHHDYERTPQNIANIYREIALLEPDVIKIVTYANDVRDNLRIFNLLQNTKLPTIAFCMGEKGTPSRILCRKFGGVMTYAALSEDTANSPGQLTAREVRDIYNYRSVGPETKVYGLIGEDVSLSLSHVYHNLAFRKMEWPGVYVKFPVADVAQFIESFFPLVDGLSVTRPHKETILPLLHDSSPVAKRVGSINTVTKIDGNLVGDNVDRLGAVRALEAVTEISGKTALVIGAGGTGKAVAYGLKGAGAFVVVVNRTLSKAEKLAKEVEGVAKNFDFLESKDYDILVNATPVGSDPLSSETPVPPHCLRSSVVVFDVVYPHTTQLLRDAAKAGCKTVGGLSMFLNQAYEQLKIWLPSDYRRGVEQEELEKEFYRLMGGP